MLFLDTASFLIQLADLGPTAAMGTFIVRKASPRMKWDGLFRNLGLQAQTLAISSSDLVSGEKTLVKVAQNLSPHPSSSLDSGL